MNRQSIFVRIQRGTNIVIITFRERGPVHVQFKCVSEEIWFHFQTPVVILKTLKRTTFYALTK